MPDYEPVIGLETHMQLNTQSKIFRSYKADSGGKPPHTNICPVCTGLPVPHVPKSYRLGGLGPQ